MSDDRLIISWGHNPPLTSEQMVAHYQRTAEVLVEAGIPMVIVTQEPKRGRLRAVARKLRRKLIPWWRR